MMFAPLWIAGLVLAPKLQDVAPKVAFKLDPKSLVAGGTLKGTVTLTFSDGFHAYPNPPANDSNIPVSIVAAKGGKLVKVVYPKGEPLVPTDPSLVYKGVVEFGVQLKAAAKPGKQVVALEVHYQQCDDKACFPPGTVTVSSTAVLRKK